MVVDDNPKGPSIWSLNVPFKFVANATDELFVELTSGMTFFDLSQTIRTLTSGLVQGPFYFIPLGARVGYAVEARATMMDVFVNFNFPAFYGFTHDLVVRRVLGIERGEGVDVGAAADADPFFGEENRVNRGGGWFDGEEGEVVATYNRNAGPPDISANDDIGFRCARDAQ